MHRYHFFAAALSEAMEGGLLGAAIFDRDGEVVSSDGAIENDEAKPLASAVMYELRSPDLASRLFAGEIISTTIDGREVVVAVASRQLFVVAILKSSTLVGLMAVRALRDAVALQLPEPELPGPFDPRGGGGGAPGQGPAELQLVEYGLTAWRERAKA
jgi:hypothetical protein